MSEWTCRSCGFVNEGRTKCSGCRRHKSDRAKNVSYTPTKRGNDAEHHTGQTKNYVRNGERDRCVYQTWADGTSWA